MYSQHRSKIFNRKIVNKNVLVCVIILSGLYSKGYSQNTWTWFDDFGYYRTTAGCVLNESNEILVYSSSTNNGTTTAYLSAIDSLGNTLWSKDFPSLSLISAADINLLPNGDLLLLNNIYPGGVPAPDIQIIKTDPAGEIIWTTEWGSSGWETGNRIFVTSNGDILIPGKIESNQLGSDITDGLLLCIDGDGTVLWYKIYGSEFNIEDEVTDVLETDDGGYLICGNNRFYSPRNYSGWLIKTDSIGDTLWTRYFGLGPRAYFNSIAEIDSGLYGVAGNIGGVGQDARTWVVCVNGIGITQWEQTYELEEPGFAERIIKVDSLHLMISGTSLNDNLTNYNAFLLKVTLMGELDWFRNYGGQSIRAERTRVLKTNGGYAFAGDITFISTSNDASWVVSTDSNGNTDGIATSIHREISNPRDFTLNVYPNPFNGGLKILSPNGNHTGILKIYNMAGRLVDHFELNFRDDSQYIIWTPRNNSSGVYLLEYSSNNERYLKKVVYLK